METPSASGVAAVGDMAVADDLEGCLGVGARSGRVDGEGGRAVVEVPCLISV